MARALANFVCLGVLGLGLAFAAQAQKYGAITAGPQEDTSKVGGISKQEMDALDDQARKILEKFKEGRKEDKGRFFDGVVFHDANYDGVADHGKGTGNAFETSLDDAANASSSKKIKTGDGGTREDEIDQARLNAGRCKGGKIPGAKPGEGDCKNISANIVDVGPAHGDEKESHRIYDLSDEAFKKSKESGETYAKKVIAGAANYDVNNDAAREMKMQEGGVDKDGKYILVDGKKVGVGANISYMQSEAAFLNEASQKILETEWRALRAQRLAGSDTSKGQTDKELAQLMQNADKKDLDKVGDDVADFIAKRRELSGREIDCTQKSTECQRWAAKVCANKTGKDATDCKDLFAAGKKVKPSDINGDAASKKEALDLAEKEASTDQNFQKDLAKKVAEVKKCMKPGVWCDDQYKETKGDPGSAFKDTREYIFANSAAMLNRTPEAALKMLQGMSADISAQTDSKAKNVKQYKGWMDQIKAAQQMRDTMIQEARKKGLPPPLPANASIAQIFNSRDMSRPGEGDTLGRKGFGFQAQGPKAPPGQRAPTGTPPTARRGSPVPTSNPFFRQAVNP